MPAAATPRLQSCGMLHVCMLVALPGVCIMGYTQAKLYLLSCVIQKFPSMAASCPEDSSTSTAATASAAADQRCSTLAATQAWTPPAATCSKQSVCGLRTPLGVAVRSSHGVCCCWHACTWFQLHSVHFDMISARFAWHSCAVGRLCLSVTH
jgi:hypothetical protein